MLDLSHGVNPKILELVSRSIFLQFKVSDWNDSTCKTPLTEGYIYYCVYDNKYSTEALVFVYFIIIDFLKATCQKWNK